MVSIINKKRGTLLERKEEKNIISEVSIDGIIEIMNMTNGIRNGFFNSLDEILCVIRNEIITRIEKTSASVNKSTSTLINIVAMNNVKISLKFNIDKKTRGIKKRKINDDNGIKFIPVKIRTGMRNIEETITTL
ncbi:MAG TPA: hypothetical protein VK870_12910 [Ignavibacteriaceae bacterium]|nr:hypothetical protein [Ignavibacteriaceae bacterium]